MAIEIIEQFRIFRNEPLLTRDSVATITDRNNIPVEERFNGIKTIVRSEGKRYEIIYSGNFNSLSTAAKNAFLADNNNWKEVVGNAALDLKEDKANKGVANGYTPLGADTKIPLQYIPDSLLGALEYKGVWSATTNTAPHGSPENGWYYKVNVAGQTTFTGSTVDWAIGDWIIYNGTTWDRVANADKVISVNGDEGEVIIDDSNLEHEPAVSIPTWISSVYTAGKAILRSVLDAVITRIGIMDTQLTDIEDKLDTIEEGANNYSPPDYYGDVEILETGQTIINDGVVSNSQLESMPANSFKMAITAGPPINGTLAQAKTALSLPTNTASDLSAAQSAISALQTLVASDNFNLDTVQEIVDFIEANRDDLNTYVADLNNKVDKEVGKSLISIDEIARLLTMETNAKDDQTETEIRDLLITLTGTNRLPYSAIKDTPIIADNLTTQSAAQILSANMGYVINQNLIAKQAAIDSLIQLVASDNFNLDTVQEIVDFIEQNRTDLDTYVANLPTATSLAGLGLTANGSKIDLGGSITSGQEVVLAANGSGIIRYALLSALSKIIYNVNNGSVEYDLTGGTGTVKFNGVVDTEFLQNGFTIGGQSITDVIDFQAIFGKFRLYSEKYLFENVPVNTLYRIDNEILNENGVFKLTKTTHTSGATIGDPDIVETTGIEFTNDGPILIGTPSDSPNALIRRSDLGTGGSSLEIATEAENIAGTNNTKASSPLGVVQNIQGRAGFGLTWNAMTNKFELGNNASSDPSEIYRTINIGDIGVMEFQGGFASEVRVYLEGAGARGFRVDVGTDVAAVKSEFEVFNKSINFKTGTGSSEYTINVLTNTFNINASEATLSSVASGPNSLVNRAHTDRTGVGTTITASRQLVLADTDKNKITPVNSASNVVLTIPADATLNMPIGSTINLRRRGAGSVEILGAAGVTVEGIQDASGDYKIVRYGIVSVYKEAANLWVVYGALES